MNGLGTPGLQDPTELTPLADALYFSTLHRCRALLPADRTSCSMLIVNGGWGADSRYFRYHGQERLVICDISEKMLALARDRCDGAPVCATATERLPFADGAFDLVGVRSGLHHLEDPWAGLKEMTRVARVGVFFIEGQDTPLVPALVALGALEAVEEAGNPVYRFRVADVDRAARELGSGRCVIERGWYLQIPLLIGLASWVRGRWAPPLYWGFVRVLNAFAGRWGNALIVYIEK